MTTPLQALPATVETLLGFGAFQVGTPGAYRYGQTITEDIAQTLIQGASTALLGAYTTVEEFLVQLGAYLSTLPLEALQWMRQFIPGSVLADFDTISSAVATILGALHLDNLVMRAADFIAWLEATYTILETEVHQVLDAFTGTVITPITSRVAAFLDWLDALTSFRSETAGTLTTLLGYFAALISGVGGTLISDVSSAIVEGVTALARLTTLITSLGGTTITDLVDLIAGAVADVATSLAHWVTLITGLGGTTVSDVVAAIGSGVTALSRIVSLISGTGGTTIADVVTAINDAYTHAASALTTLGSLITGLGGTTISDTVTFLSNASTKAISAFNAIAALISGVGGAVIGDVAGTINTSATGVADALAKLAALISGVGGTTIADVVSTLQHLNLSGLFDAAQLTGTLASTILVQIVNAIIALFPNKFSGLTGLTGLGDIFTDLVSSLGIASSLGSGSPVLHTLASDIPVLVPALEIVQGVADGAGKAVQGASAFVQTLITDAATAEASIQAQFQAVIPFVIPHFW